MSNASDPSGLMDTLRLAIVALSGLGGSVIVAIATLRQAKQERRRQLLEQIVETVNKVEVARAELGECIGNHLNGSRPLFKEPQGEENRIVFAQHAADARAELFNSHTDLRRANALLRLLGEKGARDQLEKVYQEIGRAFPVTLPSEFDGDESRKRLNQARISILAFFDQIHAAWERG